MAAWGFAGFDGGGLELGGFFFLAEFFHGGGYQFLGVVDALHDGLEVEGGFGGVAGGGAVNAVLADEGEGVGEDVEGDGEAATFGAQHEFVFFEVLAAVPEDGHF